MQPPTLSNVFRYSFAACRLIHARKGFLEGMLVHYIKICQDMPPWVGFWRWMCINPNLQWEDVVVRYSDAQIIFYGPVLLRTKDPVCRHWRLYLWNNNIAVNKCKMLSDRHSTFQTCLTPVQLYRRYLSRFNFETLHILCVVFPG